MRRGSWVGLIVLLFLPMAACGAPPRAKAPVRPSTGGLTVVTSELSPAVLVQTGRSRLTLFGNLSRWGLGAPTHVALSTPQGVKALSRESGGAALTLPVATMREPWMLVWFAGASGWKQWDSPWLVVWQRRPQTVALEDGGLRATGPATGLGTVAMMPLYGLGKPDTRAWHVPPADALQRCRFWARAVRRYPVACDEAFRVELATDSIAVRDRFRWLATEDDWHTAPLMFAPLSPTLALARQGGRMPMTVSGTVQDAGVVTSFGPYAGVANVDGYEVRFPVLHYLTQTEEDQPANTADPVVRDALGRLQAQMGGLFSSGDGLFHQDFGDPPHFADPPSQQGGDSGNSCWAFMSVQYPCRALPYLTADVKARALPRLHRYFADWVLQPGRYKPFQGKLLLEGPGIGSWGTYGDAGKFSSNTLISIWAYAHATGDWALIKQRWPLIQKLFVTPRECTWRGYGRDAIAEMGDEAAPAMAMARLAWFAEDRETFDYAAYIFARELVHHAVKHTGAAYFVAHPFLNSAEPMPPDVYLTNLWGDMAGWQIDGPTYPAQAGERQYTNRWVRFGDPDVARFHRDHFQDLDRRELDGLLASGRFTTQRKGSQDDAHTLPSMVRLRSLLLNEAPAALARMTSVTAPTGSPGGDAAYCLAFIRTGRPVRQVTLMSPDASATTWRPGIERDRPQDEPVLTATVQGQMEQTHAPGLPAVTWFGWKPPKVDVNIPGGNRWSFGQILTDKPLGPMTTEHLSWNTVALHYRP